MASPGTKLAASTPLMRASPMFPAPRKPTFWPLMLTTRSSCRPRRARPEDGRSHPDHGGALLDGHLVVGAHAHRQLGQPVTLPEPAQRLEPAPRLLRALG